MAQFSYDLLESQLEHLALVPTLALMTWLLTAASEQADITASVHGQLPWIQEIWMEFLASGFGLT